MRHIKAILRLHFESNLSQHQIAACLKLSVGVVNKYLNRALALGLTWPLPQEYEDEVRLKRYLRPPKSTSVLSCSQIDFSKIHQELKRKGVTLQLLWEEYLPTLPTPLSYSHFCLQYREWKKCQPQSMRQTHKAGDKVFVDYAGQTIDIIDPDTGEIRSAQIFVGVLGASNYTFVEATWTQQLPDWIGSHRRMLEFFGGVPKLIVPDNLKSAISKACRYEPDVNPTYADFIDYYGTAVLPARPGKPKDKSKVENAVLVTERWILARLRHHTFFGLAELNQAIRKLLQDLNQRTFKKMPGSRHSLFLELDKPALKALPHYPYELAYFKKAKVHIDYHVELEGHYYSVPYQWIGQIVELRYTEKYLEVWHHGKRIALQVRNFKKGAHTTLKEHMPKAHQKHMEWSPGRFLNWSSQIGPGTTRLVKYLLESKTHPEQGYRSCLGLLSLSKQFGPLRLEKACQRAWELGTKTRRSVESMLTHQLEDKPIHQKTDVDATLFSGHSNIRGKQYYH